MFLDELDELGFLSCRRVVDLVCDENGAQPRHGYTPRVEALLKVVIDISHGGGEWELDGEEFEETKMEWETRDATWFLTRTLRQSGDDRMHQTLRAIAGMRQAAMRLQSWCDSGDGRRKGGQAAVREQVCPA